MPTLALVLRSLAAAAMLSAGIAVAGAQVPPPAAEPGSVPETQPASQSPMPPSARTARISGGVIAGLKLGGDQPVYPAEAKARGIGGTVVLHALIGKDGHIASLTLVSGNSLLADAALDAVRTWTYRPYLLNGEATEVDTTITVNFNLAPSVARPDAPGGERPIKMVRSMPGSEPPSATGPAPQAVLLSRVPPAYPALARAARVQGEVVVTAVITKDGRIRDPEAIAGPDMLRAAAVEAVRQWVYEPPLRNGSPTEVLTRVTVSFSLNPIAAAPPQ